MKRVIWKSFSSALLLAMVVGYGCASPRWYEGGTLMQATVAEWAQAPARDQLATAAFIAANVFDFDDEYAWMDAASTIQSCVNRTALSDETSEIAGRLSVTEAAGLCVAVMDLQRGMHLDGALDSPAPPN